MHTSDASDYLRADDSTHYLDGPMGEAERDASRMLSNALTTNFVRRHVVLDTDDA